MEAHARAIPVAVAGVHDERMLIGNEGVLAAVTIIGGTELRLYSRIRPPRARQESDRRIDPLTGDACVLLAEREVWDGTRRGEWEATL